MTTEYKLIELWNSFATNVISNDDKCVALCVDDSDNLDKKFRLLFYNKAKSEWELNDNEYIVISYSCGNFNICKQDYFYKFLCCVEYDHRKWLSENPDTLPQLMQYKKLFKLLKTI